MRTWIKAPLLLALILCLAAIPALSRADTQEQVDIKLSHFFDALVKDGAPLDVTDFDERKHADSYQEGTTTTYYELADYLMIMTYEDEDGPAFHYHLVVLHAELPDDIDADNLYAMFLSACADEEVDYEETAALVTWLREYTVQTSLYSATASRAFQGFTATLSVSLSDSEEIMTLSRYGGIGE